MGNETVVNMKINSNQITPMRQHHESVVLGYRLERTPTFQIRADISENNLTFPTKISEFNVLFPIKFGAYIFSDALVERPGE